MDENNVRLTKEEKRIFLNAIGKRGEKLDEPAKLSWDGSSVLLRLPKTIADYFKVGKDNAKSKEIRFIVEEKEKGGKMILVTKFEIKKRSENGKKQKKV